MTIQKFRKTILDWYQKNRRDPRTRASPVQQRKVAWQQRCFTQQVVYGASSVRGRLPWRNTKDPYKILVSEMMLQQTQVARVLPKYKEFLKVFPTLSILARARIRRVLQVWKGLGYWRRAIFLRETAKKILKEYKGKFPRDPNILETFPGIGSYTARAVTCFAFGNSEAFLDTNIRRVYLHFFFPPRLRSGQANKKVSDKEILTIAEKALLPLSYGRRKVVIDSKEWHYALMDYGAIVLKDKEINKRSSHYHRQSKFEGSFRSFRTKVVRLLLAQPQNRILQRKLVVFLKNELHKQKSSFRINKILESLLKDKLLKKSERYYSL